MDYKKIYESQYGEKKLIGLKQSQFFGLREFLKRWYIDRYDMAYKLASNRERVLDVGCCNICKKEISIGCNLRKILILSWH